MPSESHLSRPFRFSWLAAAIVLAFGSPAFAQTTYTWNNYTGTTPAATLWSAGANWNGGVVPTFNQDATLLLHGEALMNRF